MQNTVFNVFIPHYELCQYKNTRIGKAGTACSMRRPPTWRRYPGPGRMIPEAFREADGGMTLYIRHELPGADQELNWMPAPAHRSLPPCFCIRPNQRCRRANGGCLRSIQRESTEDGSVITSTRGGGLKNP